MKLILYAAIILSTLCSISEAGTVVSAHWEATITNMDSQISEVRVRRDAADIEMSAESHVVEDQCNAEIIRLRKIKRKIVKAFAAWKDSTESIDTKIAEVRERREAAELDDTSTESDAVLEQCHAELRSLKRERLKIKPVEIPKEVETEIIATKMNLLVNEIVSFALL